MSAGPQKPSAGATRDWNDLDPRERWRWWDQRWHEAIALSERYRLALRSGWWEDSLRVEALAAFAAWLAIYDTEVSIDPQGKLQLLTQLEWLRTTLRGGEQAFDPQADRAAFDRHLITIGCLAPHGRQLGDPRADPQLERRDRGLCAQLSAVESRLSELTERERTLHSELERTPANYGARRELSELERGIGQLRQRQRELRSQLDQTRDTS